MYKPRQGCKRLYRYWDTDANEMYYKGDFDGSIGRLICAAETFPKSITLMEGVEVSGRNVYCGDILVDCNQGGIYVCEQNEFGELSLGLCLPVGLQYIMTSTLISKFCFTSVYIAGNIYQNPELLETGGEKCTS